VPSDLYEYTLARLNVGSTLTGYTRAGSCSHANGGLTVSTQLPPSCFRLMGAFAIAGSRTPATPDESIITAGGIDIATLPSEVLTMSTWPSTPNLAVKPVPEIRHL